MTNPSSIPANANYVLIPRHVGDLWVDPQVQRAAKKGRIDAMAADFHPEALGTLTTSFRSESRVHIIDGQHRYRAAEAAGYTGIIHTKQYSGLTVQQEAALFRLLNKTEKVSPVDQFLVACVEGDPTAVHLAAILGDNGWTIANTASKGKISAIRSLERVYLISSDAAAAAVAVVTAAYGHQGAAVQGSLVEGLGRMLARYGTGEGGVDLEVLAKRLSAFPGGPEGLVGYARGQAVTRTGNLSSQVARVITNTYNQRRRSTALPEWQ